MCVLTKLIKSLDLNVEEDKTITKNKGKKKLQLIVTIKLF